MIFTSFWWIKRFIQYQILHSLLILFHKTVYTLLQDIHLLKFLYQNIIYTLILLWYQAYLLREIFHDIFLFYQFSIYLIRHRGKCCLKVCFHNFQLFFYTFYIMRWSSFLLLFCYVRVYFKNTWLILFVLMRKNLDTF